MVANVLGAGYESSTALPSTLPKVCPMAHSWHADISAPIQGQTPKGHSPEAHLLQSSEVLLEDKIQHC